MLTFKIAFRNMFRQRRRSFLTALTMIIAFVLFSLSLSISDGAYGSMIDMFTKDHTGHIQIHADGYINRPSLYRGFTYSAAMEKTVLSQPHVVSATPRVLSSALAFVETKTTGVKLMGIDPVKERAATRIANKIKQGSFLSGAPDEAMIGKTTADLLGAKVGGELVLISQAADGSIANEIFKVTGILGDDRDSSESNNVYITLAKAQDFLMLGTRVHEVAVILDKYNRAERSAKELGTKLEKASFENLDVSPWQVIEEAFYRSMQSDRKGHFISMVILIIIVGLGVLNTVLMAILERTREYGVMSAVGTRPARIFSAVVLETVFLALLSCAVGAFLSVFVNLYFKVYGITYPDPVTVGSITVTTLYADYTVGCFLWPLSVIIISAVGVSVFPALRAAKISPAKALRSY